MNEVSQISIENMTDSEIDHEIQYLTEHFQDEVNRRSAEMIATSAEVKMLEILKRKLKKTILLAIDQGVITPIHAEIFKSDPLSLLKQIKGSVV